MPISTAAATGVDEGKLARLLARSRSWRGLLGGLGLVDEIRQYALLHLIVVVLIIGAECVAVRPGF